MAAQIGAILLAAGSSQRMGAVNKLLIEVEGTPMVARVAAAIREAGLPLLVVLGHQADAVQRAILGPSPAKAGEGQARLRAREREGPFLAAATAPSLSLASLRSAFPSPAFAGEGSPQPTFLLAADHALGMGHSLAAAIAAVPPEWTGALVCLADMPFVSADLLRHLAAALAAPGSVAVPVHAGRRGNPVGWGRAWFPCLTALTGDTGARALLANACPVLIEADMAVLRDIDTAADLARASPAWSQ